MNNYALLLLHFQRDICEKGGLCFLSTYLTAFSQSVPPSLSGAVIPDDAQTASGAQRHNSLTRIGRHFLLCSCYGRLDLFLSAVARLIDAAPNLRIVRRA